MKRIKWYLLALAAVNLALIPLTVSEAAADSGSKACYFHGPGHDPPNACSCIEHTYSECSTHGRCAEIYETLCGEEEN